MSPGTVVVGLAVAALLAAVIVYLVRSRRAGRSTCAAGCGDCGSAPACACDPATRGRAAGAPAGAPGPATRDRPSGAPGPVKLTLRPAPAPRRPS
jgi:hypothetical protein